MKNNNKMEVKVIKVNSIEELLSIIAGKCPVNEYKTVNPEGGVVNNGEILNMAFIRLAQKKDWKVEKVIGWLNSIGEVYPIAAFSIVLREIAIMLDEKYPDHINKSEKIFTVSPLDGRIHEICKAHVKNYRNFAAFRSIDDAKFACSVLRNHLKGMFTNAK